MREQTSQGAPKGPSDERSIERRVERLLVPLLYALEGYGYIEFKRTKRSREPALSPEESRALAEALAKRLRQSFPRPRASDARLGSQKGGPPTP